MREGNRGQGTPDTGQRCSVLGTQYLVLCAAMAASGCHPVATAQPKAASEQTAAVEVVVADKPARKTLPLTTTQPARIEALEQAPIYSKLASYVGEVLVDYGDKVTKDQPLLKLVAPELDADLVQKKALVQQAMAQLAQAEAGAKAAEAAIATAQSKATQAEAGSDRAHSDVARWRSELARLTQLATSGSINRQLVDETLQKLGAAEASLKEAVAAIEAAKSLVWQAQAEAVKAASDVTAGKAHVHVAEANAARSEAEHSYLTIKAPFDGVVTLRRVDPGHFVQPAVNSSSPLLVVARIDKMRVFVQINEVEAAYVDVGDPASIEVPSLRGAEFKGQVTRTSFALDSANRSLDTIIDLDNRERRLRPGLYGMAKILLEERKDVLVLPSAAIVRQGKDAYCFRLIGGKAVRTPKPITLGIKVGDEFEVVSGISDSDVVILNKASALKDGQPVEVPKQAAK